MFKNFLCGSIGINDSTSITFVEANFTYIWISSNSVKMKPTLRMVVIVLVHKSSS